MKPNDVVWSLVALCILLFIVKIGVGFSMVWVLAPLWLPVVGILALFLALGVVAGLGVGIIILCGLLLVFIEGEINENQKNKSPS